MRVPSFSRIVPELEEEAKAFETATRRLASAVDRILRKHGKNIIGKQFASTRLANVLIDLFVYACVLSRVSTAVEKTGFEEAAPEVEILKIFAGRALARVEENFAGIDDNDDELVKSVADHALEAGGFAWDAP